MLYSLNDGPSMCEDCTLVISIIRFDTAESEGETMREYLMQVVADPGRVDSSIRTEGGGRP